MSLPNQTPQKLIAQYHETHSNNLSFFQQFKTFASARIARLQKTIFGDLQYQPKNSYKLEYKQKIFAYLKSKYLTTMAQLQEENAKKFTRFDPNYGLNVQFKNLKHVKEVLLKLKTNIQAAQDSLKQSQISTKQIQINFFNEAAYEFNMQRVTSIFWGLLLASLICSTIYRRGSIARKGALFLTTGHIFGQISYHYNIDKFFDTVYPIFEQDALQYIRRQQLERIRNQSMSVKGASKIED